MGLHRSRSFAVVFAGAFAVVSLLVSAGAGQVKADGENAGNGDFRIVMTELNSSPRWTSVRYHQRTGAAWIISGDVWVAIKEAEGFKRKKGSYTVKLMPFGERADFAAIRLEKTTGRTWFLKDQRWLPMAVFDQ